MITYIGSGYGKNVYLAEHSAMEPAPLDLSEFLGHFSVLVLLKSIYTPTEDIKNFAEQIISARVQCVTINGPASEEVHDLIDAIRDRNYVAGAPVIMTAFMEDSERDALEYALVSAVPDPGFTEVVTNLIVYRNSCECMSGKEIKAFLDGDA